MTKSTLSKQIKKCERSIKNIYQALESLLKEIENAYPELPIEINKETTPKSHFIYPEDCTNKILKKLLYRQVAVPAKVSGITTKHAHYHANTIRGTPHNVH